MAEIGRHTVRDTSGGLHSTPIGVKECSHGWRSPRRPEPVVGKRSSCCRPERAEDRFHILIPPPRRGGSILFFHFHGFRFAAPVATVLSPSEAENRLRRNCHGPRGTRICELPLGCAPGSRSTSRPRQRFQMVPEERKTLGNRLRGKNWLVICGFRRQCSRNNSGIVAMPAWVHGRLEQGARRCESRHEKLGQFGVAASVEANIAIILA